jgi:hypothetical protein
LIFAEQTRWHASGLKFNIKRTDVMLFEFSAYGRKLKPPPRRVVVDSKLSFKDNSIKIFVNLSRTIVHFL